jgi:hypothetical protein
MIIEEAFFCFPSFIPNIHLELDIIPPKTIYSSILGCL